MAQREYSRKHCLLQAPKFGNHLFYTKRQLLKSLVNIPPAKQHLIDSSPLISTGGHIEIINEEFLNYKNHLKKSTILAMFHHLGKVFENKAKNNNKNKNPS